MKTKNMKKQKKTELKEEIKALRLSNTEKTETKNHAPANKTDSKKMNLASTIPGGQNETV